MPLRARRLLAALLVGAAMAALLAGAARQDLSLADSLAMAGRYWHAGPRGRLLNSPALARDAEFAAAALRASRTWPPEVDALLAVGPVVPPPVRERLRRVAAYLLAPRRVLLVPGSGAEVDLTPAPRGDAGR